MNRKCYLKCLDNSHEPILLKNKEEVIIGRSPLTKIANKRCSRNQVSLVAHTFLWEVRVKQLGENSSSINSILLKKGERQVLKHGDSIDLVHGLFKHKIEFDPPPPISEQANNPAETEEKNTSKRPTDVSCSSPEQAKKKAKVEEKEQTQSLLTVSCEENKWEIVDNRKMLVFTSKGVQHSSKIASYDLDWTLIGTRSGRVYPKDKDDWCILLPEIPGHLKKLKSEGYKLVLFSNQNGIGTGKVKITEFQSKIESVVARLGVPMQAFISTGPSLYRKPSTGMWQTLIRERNAGVAIDLDASYYCGDAAGRPKDWAHKKKKDFSCSDRLFAMNIGIKFFTPEEHFQKSRSAPFSLPEFQPMNLPRDIPECHPPTTKLVSQSQELAILVGCPGSGKSFVARHRFVTAGYKHVNLDELKSPQKCLEAVRISLEAGHSVVVDNTNPDIKSRARFLQIAKSKNVKCRCLLMATTPAHARHNNRFRELTDRSHTIIPEMIIRTYEKNYQEPKLEEGFTEIVKVNCIPQFSDDDELKSLYESFLVA